MAHDNTILRSVNQPDGPHCVDLFQRPDGSFGFGEFRREPEDGRGWFGIGQHQSRRFNSKDEAWAAAQAEIGWLNGRD